MKIKIKLSIIVTAIVVIVAGSIAVILLKQATNISLESNLRGLKYLARDQYKFGI